MVEGVAWPQLSKSKSACNWSICFCNHFCVIYKLEHIGAYRTATCVLVRSQLVTRRGASYLIPCYLPAVAVNSNMPVVCTCDVLDDAVTSFAQVMCLFCEEEPASEQEPAVHRRDRFCSVECMEVRCAT